MNSFIHPNAQVDSSAIIGNFVSIYDNVIIKSGAKIEDGARIYQDCIIGENSVVGPNVVLRPKTIIGKNTIIGPLSESDGNCAIGDNTTIHAHCQIAWGTKIGNNCFIGSYFMSSNTKEISNGEHGTSPNKKPVTRYPTIIEDFVRIGIKVTAIPSITVGHHSLIYQNTLITKDIEPYSVIKSGKDQVGIKVDTIQN